MFAFPQLKLYRKFLVLALLSAALFFTSASQPVKADPCCDNCVDTRTSCYAYCNSNQIKDWMVPGCIADCDSAYTACIHICAPPPAPQCPVS